MLVWGVRGNKDMKVSNKWKNKVLTLYKEAVQYLEFSSFVPDWSDKACYAYYVYESKGDYLDIKENNGCKRGKFLLDLHLGLWKEGIKEEITTKQELVRDFNFSPQLSAYIGERL